uniref:Nucleolar protein 10 n=1 Tax=Timema poppense TaxID=170557 RepID=A0A7R9GX05_TIMPO|nr:unnamed protein product [Timema poppensis]
MKEPIPALPIIVLIAVVKKQSWVAYGKILTEERVHVANELASELNSKERDQIVRYVEGFTSGPPLDCNVFHVKLNKYTLMQMILQKVDPDGQPTKSAHPARFSPEDKYSRQRITIKKRFNLLLTQQPAPVY